MSTSSQNVEGSSLTLSLTCGLTGYYPTQFGNVRTGEGGPKPAGDVQGGFPEKVNLASTYFYVKGTGIGRASDDLDMEELPAAHPGRAWGAKRWGDLWGAKMQPRYEVDIALSVTSQQPVPPVYFVTGVTYHGGSDYRGTPVQSMNPTVQRSHDTNLVTQRVSLIRFCNPESTETVSVTVTGTITGKRPRPADQN